MGHREKNGRDQQRLRKDQKLFLPVYFLGSLTNLVMQPVPQKKNTASFHLSLRTPWLSQSSFFPHTGSRTSADASRGL